jgi:hypothetical protein
MEYVTRVLGFGDGETLPLHSGERIVAPLIWNNVDGTARDMSLASVYLDIKDSTSTVIYDTILADAYVLELPADVTAGWADGSYTGHFIVDVPGRAADTANFQILVGGQLIQEVEIFLHDDSPLRNHIQGATVEIVDPDTSEHLASGVSGVDGRSAIALPGDYAPGRPYEVRIFKSGVVFPNPTMISVVDPVVAPITNRFDVSGTILNSWGVPSDPNLCRCSGRFVNFSNAPIAKVLVIIYAQADPVSKVPKTVNHHMISSQAMEFYTDKNGYIVVDLVRSSEYRVTFAGEDDITWSIKVPDRALCDFIDLIHPQPVSLAWDSVVAPNNLVTLDVGDILDVPCSITFSNYEVSSNCLSTAAQFSTADGAIVETTVVEGMGVRLVGIAAGTTSVSVTAANPPVAPVQVPAYSLNSTSLTIVVNP